MTVELLMQIRQWGSSSAYHRMFRVTDGAPSPDGEGQPECHVVQTRRGTFCLNNEHHDKCPASDAVRQQYGEVLT